MNTSHFPTLPVAIAIALISVTTMGGGGSRRGSRIGIAKCHPSFKLPRWKDVRHTIWRKR